MDSKQIDIQGLKAHLAAGKTLEQVVMEIEAPAAPLHRQVIQLTAKIRQSADEKNQPAIAVDFSVISDARPIGGPEWKSGDLESGPNYHAGIPPMKGQLPEGGLSREFVDALGIEVKEFIASRLRRMYGG